MCLAVPGKILEFVPDTDPAMAKVSFDGLIRQVCVEWIPEVEIGDYVIVHTGFAINKMNESEALETLKIFAEMDKALEKESENE